MINYILLGCAVPLTAGAVIMNRSFARKSSASDEARMKYKKKKTIMLLLAVIGAYIFITRLISVVFSGSSSKKFDVEIWAERTELFGFEISTTVIFSWIIMAVLVLLALILRFTVLRKMKDVPSGAQNVLETLVDVIADYTKSKTGKLGDGLTSYIVTVGLFLVSCAALELFGFRAPTADITMTFALAAVTFFLINFYGVRKKGVVGRIKGIAGPAPLVFPIRVICDCAIPVSMACRLFGNMLGGMIVMDLLYTSLGNNAVGLPSLAGLYFNVFHPIIQAFIFVTLTLTFINEATEDAE